MGSGTAKFSAWDGSGKKGVGVIGTCTLDRSFFFFPFIYFQYYLFLETFLMYHGRLKGGRRGVLSER